MKGARSHEELIVWQLSYELKIAVYDLIKTTPIRSDRNLHDQLRNAAGAALLQSRQWLDQVLANGHAAE